MGGVGLVGPRSAILDEGEVAGDDDAHAGAVLEFVVPDALEWGGEQKTDGGEHIQIEEGVAVRVWGGELAWEDAVGDDLGADEGGFV